MLAAAAALGGHAETLSLDFRGTGRSGGRYTFGRSEHLDLRAGIEWACTRYERVYVVGLSMGAAIAVRALGESAGAIRGALYVSCPSSLRGVLLTGGPLRQSVARWRGVESWALIRWAGGKPWMRYGNPFAIGVDASQWAARVHVPGVFVVGGNDPLVVPALSRRVYEAYAGPKRLIEIAGGRHAEYLMLSHPAAMSQAVLQLFALVGDEEPGP